jgi:hypothetical protein
MRLSLKAKLTALITVLVLLVVMAISTVYISNLTRQALLDVQSKGEYVAYEVSHQAGAAMAGSRMPEGKNLKTSRHCAVSCSRSSILTRV